jgi:hypothetical protein
VSVAAHGQQAAEYLQYWQAFEWVSPAETCCWFSLGLSGAETFDGQQIVDDTDEELWCCWAAKFVFAICTSTSVGEMFCDY